MAMKNVIIMGAGGRDFHNFLMHFKDNSAYNVVAFTATQIPGIEKRKFPASLAGRLYKKGIPIYPEEKLPQLIRKLKVDDVVFAYSDVSHEYVMHKASLVLSCGANFVLLGPKDTMLKSKKKVISVCAVRTGAGKSQTTRAIAKMLKKHGEKVAIIRHSMPYGNLEKQAVQRFANYKDLKKNKVTIEEREEYEPHINAGFVVYAGVDYEKILRKAEKESNVIIFDGGNNDFSFFKSDLYIVVADPHRAGHELAYHPGETNLRMADAVIINKVDSARREDIKTVIRNAKNTNPKAKIILAKSPVTVDSPELIKNKKVIVIEDGPTITHGGMPYGAGTIAARRYNCGIIDARKHAVGSIKELYKKYPHLKKELPAMGYSTRQTKELQETINRAKCDAVIDATPVNLSRILKVNKPIANVSYELGEEASRQLHSLLKKLKFIK
ncbi:MAG: GTPase [Candidatus Aenigmarchaeota archaeon]|nr:GTPase [Candidatus Aenigmarchaeota archaeon]